MPSFQSLSPNVEPPRSEAELLQRALSLAGRSFAEIAQQHQTGIPQHLRKQKGWGGMLMELCLGASAGSKPEQDFPHLGVELKTIPISTKGRALESTYVAITPLLELKGIDWQHSNVRLKLAKVLWVPIIAERGIPVAERVISTPFLWSPSPAQEAMLQKDWEDHMELISLGKIDTITAHQGEILQIRPKAANSKVRTQATGPNGQIIATLPRGFYLRSRFTSGLLADHFGLN
ncbi:DNA mismatch repair endonuclease MutH [Alginatibacterium sediminis]|uniref:DNA mismatch repair protein MutH n=1 Tax=Alginatibacterium sediminis TaxID=2164068 RepID=A0A420EJL4_9ALTE|nr:DNA mismatch repair endonuclease MutH [Alginatibacterium sediminis]RKF20912.1 DNA mismatch repair endonuclease MutH [Alginatibacterium sediminis]